MFIAKSDLGFPLTGSALTPGRCRGHRLAPGIRAHPNIVEAMISVNALQRIREGGHFQGFTLVAATR